MSLVLFIWFFLLNIDIDQFDKINKILPNSIYNIKTVIDLKGNELIMPDGVTLHFSENAEICNGTIVGNNTKISGNLCGIFENVVIKGSWNVPFIESKMLKDVQKENGLKSLLALASDKINNHVVISKGKYFVSASQVSRSILKIPSNTRLSIEGDIILMPNNQPYYNILRITGTQIHILGDGSIIGDRESHKGTTGEWGFGIEINNGSNISINGISIKDCWGDCIYIAGKSNGITISNCNLSGSRRQGISIVSANHVIIKDCLIYDIQGTSPQRAIDIEPNKKCIVDDVVISNVIAKSCFGGFMALGAAKESRIGKIQLTNCKTENTRCPYSFSHVDEIRLINCHSNEVRKPIISKCKKTIIK